MSVETARLILIGITVVGGLFWAFTTQVFARSVHSERPSEPRLPAAGWAKGAENPAGDDILTGEVVAEGKPAELSTRLAETLGKVGLAGSLVRILERRDDRVVFDLFAYNSPAQPSRSENGSGLRGEVKFRAAGGGECRMEYALEPVRSRALVRAGWVLVTLGLGALVGGFVLIDNLVVQNANPAVRFQTFQMVQCVHVLWPPWLLGTLYRHQRTAQRRALEVLLANLPYV